MKNSPKPPRTAAAILSRLIEPDIREGAMGDLEENYRRITESKGKYRALMNFWAQIAAALPSFLLSSLNGGFIMIVNYFKIALRVLKRHKGFSLVNILGLAVGLSCCTLVLLWVEDEISFDRFHRHADSIFRIVCDWEKHNWNGFEMTPSPLGPAAKDLLPDILYTARIHGLHREVFQYREKAFYEDRGLVVDRDFFKIFSFPFSHGDPETAFTGPDKLVISEKMASKYFGSEAAVGKILQVNGIPKKVSGVLKNILQNSHLQFDYAYSFEFINELSGFGTSWRGYNFPTFVRLRPGADPRKIGKQLTEIAKNNESPQVLGGVTMRLQPLTRIHLDPRPYRVSTHSLGDARYIYLFSIIAGFVLLIACVNFMNLSTARSMARAKEVGLRKTVGAKKTQLIRQFFFESLLMVLLATVISLGITWTLLPAFNRISGKQMSWEYLSLNHVLGFLAVLLATGLISGIYPAFFLSSFKPASILKGGKQTIGKGFRMRRALVIFQFALAVILIFGTLVIYSQMKYIRNVKLGFDRENIFYLPMAENTAIKYATFKAVLLRSPAIHSVTAHTYDFSTIAFWRGGFEWEGKDPERRLDVIISGVDFDFFETMNMEITSGRSFSTQHSSDSDSAYIMNEEAVRILGVENPVGLPFGREGRQGSIIGVVKDAHFRSLHQRIEPRLFYIDDLQGARDFGIVLIKAAAGQIPQAVEHTQKAWESINPVSPFEFHFLDSAYDRLYEMEHRTGVILNYFTGFALLISCLGLLGLTSFIAERKTKEIGIRRVLGASSPRLALWFSAEFLRWVLAAEMLALPIAYYVMHRILQSYAYRTDICWEIFLLSGTAVTAVAALTVLYQSLKTATLDPVKALRYE